MSLLVTGAAQAGDKKGNVSKFSYSAGMQTWIFLRLCRQPANVLLGAVSRQAPIAAGCKICFLAGTHLTSQQWCATLQPSGARKQKGKEELIPVWTLFFAAVTI